ncbi:hypothetical protein PPL_05087 [Heterostelium album PN500]|uniref:Uncharacterized protein n=1 Tax=Heterostelium pallidum (strain ATCC 26659 / Pp 5 / PN500) TaxID=670386 RepID=D3B9E3_HETP5|nr:hypothetical protein PPL_05087 [Heterostelium album PN500]EFA81855.1 hypothetical protein PPL_05087 [Heterostelium album PN500]|eukprot:XP_020433972.1 hypothetical protein PPL_05087 [Heterostelium album PN500]
MGIVSLLLDCVVISTAAAGVRRTVGYDLSKTVLSKFNKPNSRAFVSGFFNVGEWVADKGTNMVKKTITNYKLNEYKPKDIKFKVDDKFNKD